MRYPPQVNQNNKQMLRLSSLSTNSTTTGFPLSLPIPLTLLSFYDLNAAAQGDKEYKGILNQ
jgi:hypothetical protein